MLDLLRRFPVTSGLSALILAAYGLQAAAGGTMELSAQLRLGALRGTLVFADGEWYRLVAAVFLHHGPVHLLFNLMALGQVGAVVELVYGSARALGAFLVCGLAGSLASAAFMGPGIAASLGASGAIMGLAGVLLAASASGSPALPPALRRYLGWRLALGVGFTFAVGIAVWFFLPVVDNACHVGGFAMGAVLGLVDRSARVHAARRWGVAGVLGAAGVAAVVATAAFGGRAAERLDADLVAILPHRLHSPPEGVADAMVVAELMQVHSRLGDPDGAVAVLAGILAEVEDSDTAMFLVQALFLAHLDAAVGPAAERWVALAPDDGVALNALAWHFASRPGGAGEDADRALSLSRRSIALLDRGDPDQEPLAAAFLDTLGELLFQRGALDEALVAQNEAVYVADRLDLAEEKDLRVRLAKIKGAVRERGRVRPAPAPP